jgi:hypothetical protein
LFGNSLELIFHAIDNVSLVLAFGKQMKTRLLGRKIAFTEWNSELHFQKAISENQPNTHGSSTTIVPHLHLNGLP